LNRCVVRMRAHVCVCVCVCVCVFVCSPTTFSAFPPPSTLSPPRLSLPPTPPPPYPPHPFSRPDTHKRKQRQARDGHWGTTTRPPRLRAGHNRRPPPTPDPIATDMTKGCATPTRQRQNQSSGSVRRPGSVEVAIPSSAELGHRGMSYRANSPTRSPAVRVGVNSTREPCELHRLID